MLLTSGQTSALISSSIVFFFTSILFVAGLFLQHQSVKNLNAVLHPTGGRLGPWERLVARAEYKIEIERERLEQAEAEIAAKKLNGLVEEALEGQEEQQTNDRAPWDRRAYVQVVHSPSQVCNAIMSVTSLSIQGSPARRVLVFPSSWIDKGTGELYDSPASELMKIGTAEHLLELVDTEVLDGSGIYEDSSSPLATSKQNLTQFLLSLDGFDRLLYLEPDGTILNATRLDTLFDLELDTAVTAVKHGRSSISPVTLLLPGSDNDVDSSDVDLGNPDSSGLGDQKLIYTTVETTRNLARIQSTYNIMIDQDPLEKIGYVHIPREEEEDEATETPEKLSDEDEDVADTRELRRRGGATLPQVMMEDDSLVYRLFKEYERQKEAVCGPTMSIIRQSQDDSQNSL